MLPKFQPCCPPKEEQHGMANLKDEVIYSGDITEIKN